VKCTSGDSYQQSTLSKVSNAMRYMGDAMQPVIEKGIELTGVLDIAGAAINTYADVSTGNISASNLTGTVVEVGANLALKKVKVLREAVEAVTEKAGNFVFRGGSGTPTNLTPRPQDIGGLSGNVNSMPGKNQVIDTSKLNQLCAVCDNLKTGHVSIKPKDMSQMQGWIDSRGTGTTHSLTQELMDAVVDQVKK